MPCRCFRYDVLRSFLFLGALAGLQLLDMSQIYHKIRGQEMIKLYVIISMVEIFDRLLTSFGQDVLDSLYWTVTLLDGNKARYTRGPNGIHTCSRLCVSLW